MQKIFTIPVLFAIEHGEHSDPDIDDQEPNDYALAFAAMSLPQASQESLLTKKAIAEALGKFAAELEEKNSGDGRQAELSMWDAQMLNIPGFAPFVVFNALVESNLSLSERQSWGQKHLLPAAEAALGCHVLNFVDFFPKALAEREAAIDAWSSLCLDSGSRRRKDPPPAEPFLAAFAQWEANGLKAALDQDRESIEPSSGASLPPLSKKPPRAL